jgi:hypothetical protein
LIDMSNPRHIKDQLYELVARLGKAASSPKRIELIELLRQGEMTVNVLAHKDDLVVLDVTPANEFLATHHSFAVSTPIDALKLRLSERPKGKTVACCRGPYSLMAPDAVELRRKTVRQPEGIVEWDIALAR